MYFAIYQAIARDERAARPLPGVRARLLRPRSSWTSATAAAPSDESNWREILEYFEPAYQLGMTATPLREDNGDTYRYFGNPIYTYSLRQGIDDGFLAPYRVHRVITEWDAAGWRPSKGELDRYGREIPDEEYHDQRLRARRRPAGPHRGDRPAPHGLPEEHRPLRQDHRLLRRPGARRRDARRRSNNLNADLVQQYPDYVCRVTADEGDIGRGHLSHFQDVETADARHPDHLAAADHRRGRADRARTSCWCASSTR